MKAKLVYISICALLVGWIIATPAASQNPEPETNPPASVSPSAGAQIKGGTPRIPRAHPRIT